MMNCVVMKKVGMLNAKKTFVMMMLVKKLSAVMMMMECLLNARLFVMVMMEKKLSALMNLFVTSKKKKFPVKMKFVMRMW